MIPSTASRLLSGIREKARFMRRSAKTLLPNRRFKQAHPGFPTPPLYVLWDAQAYTSFARYLETGSEHADIYWQIFRTHAMNRHGRQGEPYRVLEWGCGPARVVRHLPGLAAADGVAAEFYGTDYNRRSISWARATLPQVHFSQNGLAPPLPFPDAHFDYLYCRSVFTHLSEPMHFAWIRELARVVRPGGIISLSTAGHAHRDRMTPPAQARYDRGELVVRELAAEGKMMFSVWHPPAFVRERLLAGLSILEHLSPPATQEIWVARRP